MVFSKTSKWLFVHGSLITTKTREDILEDRVGFLTGALSKDVNVTSLMVVGVIYSALRCFLYATICAVIGFLMSSILPAFLYIGLLFSLYFLVSAAARIGDSPDNNESTRLKLKEVEKQLESLRKDA
ncbi:hypothetical protein CGH21_23695 [Vibrio parahaemolyticus]|nr:hypothetical protein CGH66_24045 [Vibrio parahaemolyticus]TOM99427.1 hypothetical protein CGH67_24415 [Vibrio parahaemolyticus]TON10401.1 hypothetical protein CGH64_23505 [Vibrio parahaemolyticus]TON29999.1 hypothetical protein CGH59_23160 [Vibrio parahaemolyticus]TON46765.1 hypothetical protein CGH55_23600 [Vibrio parahaemolyticus]